jgi:acetyltransferase-like isoleucine patch superfamily enzyme
MKQEPTVKVGTLEPYRDGDGNEIVYAGTPIAKKIDIQFFGRGNRLVVAADATVVNLRVMYRGDNGVVEIGSSTPGRNGMRFNLRVGRDSRIEIGDDVGCQNPVFVSAVEGANVRIGRDVMFANGVELRTDDAHAIYDVRSGERLNVSKSIDIGEHVWLAKQAVVMGGVTIGDGTVVGYRSIVTSDLPNNCVAVGAPARVVRRDVAWERPQVHRFPPGQRTPPGGRKSERYWKLTQEN